MIGAAAIATSSGASAFRSELHSVSQECALCAQGASVVRYLLPGRELMASAFLFCQYICIVLYCGPSCDRLLPIACALMRSVNLLVK